jgi:phage tail P2-like protein
MDLSNISILNLMPPNLAGDKNIKMLAETFDEILRDIINRIPNVEVIPNLVLNQTVNEILIDLLAWQFHVDFYESDLSIEIKRELVLKSLDWHYRKGTPSVVEEIISTVFTKAKIQEWYEYGDRPYRFRIATEEQIPDTKTVKKLLRAVKAAKNTRSFLDSLTNLLDFADEVKIEAELEIKIKPMMSDTFRGRLKYNGTIKYDGHTVNDEIFERSKYDGTRKYDGNSKYNGARKIPRDYSITPTFKYSSRATDRLDLVVRVQDFEEIITVTDDLAIGIRYHHKYNGQHKYAGSRKYNSTVLNPVDD